MKQREKDQIERLELEKISSEMKLNRLQKDLLQVNAKSRKTQQERKNLEQRLSGLKTSLLGAERRNVELQLALYNESKNNEKLTNDLKEMEIRLANTQQEKINREQRLNTEQSEKIKKFERDLKVANTTREGLNSQEQPSRAAAQTFDTASFVERKQTIVCKCFSFRDNCNVTVSRWPTRWKRSVKGKYGQSRANMLNQILKWSLGGYGGYGYCFLKHPKIRKNQILKWSLRVPQLSLFKVCGIGIVIILE